MRARLYFVVAALAIAVAAVGSNFASAELTTAHEHRTRADTAVFGTLSAFPSSETASSPSNDPVESLKLAMQRAAR